MFSNFLRLLAFVPIFALVGCSSSTQSIIDSIYFSSGHGDFLREGFCGIYHAHWDLSSDDEFVSKIKAEKKRCFANLSNSCDSENMRDCAAFGYLLWDEYDEFDKYEELLKKACDGKYGSACGILAFLNDDLELRKQSCEYGDFMSCYYLWWSDDWIKKRAKKLSAEACETMQKIIATKPDYDIYIKGVGNLKDLKKVDMFDKIYIQGIGLESEFEKMKDWLCGKEKLIMKELED